MRILEKNTNTQLVFVYAFIHLILFILPYGKYVKNFLISGIFESIIYNKFNYEILTHRYNGHDYPLYLCVSLLFASDVVKVFQMLDCTPHSHCKVYVS